MKNEIDPAHEIGENVTITEKSQLLSITPEQAKNIKSLRIENLNKDFDFADFFWTKCKVFDSLYFYRCGIYGCELFDIDHSDNLGCVNCSLTSNLASSVLECISQWDFIKTLDLSQNKFGEDPEKFYSWMFNHIFGTITIENLILTDKVFLKNGKKR